MLRTAVLAALATGTAAECVSQSTLLCINDASSWWPRCDASQTHKASIAGPNGYEWGFYCSSEWTNALNDMLAHSAVGKCGDKDAIIKVLAEIAYETGFYSTVYQPIDGGAGMIHMIPNNWPINARDMDADFADMRPPGISSYEAAATGKEFFQDPAYGWLSVGAWYLRTNRVIGGCALNLFDQSFDTQTRCIFGGPVDRQEAYNIVNTCCNTQGNTCGGSWSGPGPTPPPTPQPPTPPPTPRPPSNLPAGCTDGSNSCWAQGLQCYQANWAVPCYMTTADWPDNSNSEAQCGGVWCGAPPATPQPPPTPVPPPTPQPPSATASGAHRLVAYMENWSPCPDDDLIRRYTHIFIAFGTSYTNTGANSASCTIGTDIKVCSGVSITQSQQKVQAWRNMGKKVILSIGGWNMNGHWNNCFGKEASLADQLGSICEAQGFDGVDIDFEQEAMGGDFLSDMSNRMAADSRIHEVTHAPMDRHLRSGMTYLNQLKKAASSIDFIFVQYYNGDIDPQNGFTGGSGIKVASTHYARLVNEVFGGDAGKVVFGFCNGGCSGTGTDATPAEARGIMAEIYAQYPNNGGTGFWSTKFDQNQGGVFSAALDGYLQQHRSGSTPPADTPNPPAATPQPPGATPNPPPPATPEPAPVSCVENSEVEQWTTCSKTCGSGTQTRQTKYTITTLPANGGLACSCNPPANCVPGTNCECKSGWETQPCNTDACPTPAPGSGGTNCPADAYHSCQDNWCGSSYWASQCKTTCKIDCTGGTTPQTPPVDCEFQWLLPATWGTCSNNVQTRTAQIQVLVQSSNGGQDCPSTCDTNAFTCEESRSCGLTPEPNSSPTPEPSTQGTNHCNMPAVGNWQQCGGGGMPIKCCAAGAMCCGNQWWASCQPGDSCGTQQDYTTSFAANRDDGEGGSSLSPLIAGLLGAVGGISLGAMGVFAIMRSKGSGVGASGLDGMNMDNVEPAASMNAGGGAYQSGSKSASSKANKSGAIHDI